MVNFGPRATVPSEFEGRHFYEHNANVTLMRTTPEECEEVGRRIGARLSDATGPVTIVLPTRGVSSISTEGGVFCDPSADASCRRGIREACAADDEGPEILEIDAALNDPEFARQCADRLLAWLS